MTFLRVRMTQIRVDGRDALHAQRWRYAGRMCFRAPRGAEPRRDLVHFLPHLGRLLEL